MTNTQKDLYITARERGMSEIKEKDARRLDPVDAETLIRWRNCNHENLVENCNMQQLLKLYHASERYFTIEDWLDHEDGAGDKYDEITAKG